MFDYFTAVQIHNLWVVSLSASYPHLALQVAPEDNPAIEPLVDVLKNVENPDDKFDMAGSAFMVYLRYLKRH